MESVQNAIGFVIQTFSYFTNCLNSSNQNSTSTEPFEEIKERRNSNSLCIDVFYGTQTGTAEHYAVLFKEQFKDGIDVRIHDLEDFEEDLIMNSKIGVFLVATYGDGDPTDSALKLWEWLQDEKVAPGALSQMKYAVFGLGDRAYKKYCEAGKKFDKLLEKKGGNRIFGLGCGDASGDSELDFTRWLKKLVDVLNGLFNSNPDSIDINIEPKYELIYGPITQNRVVSPEYDSRIKPYLDSIDFTIVKSFELCSSKSEKSIKHIEFLPKGVITYEPGDLLYLYPTNSNELVTKVSQKLQYDLTFVVSLLPIQSGVPLLFPPSTTVKELLIRFYDITSPVKQSFLTSLIPFIIDEDEKKELTTICDDTQLFNLSVKSKLLTFVDILELYPSIKVPLKDFLEITPFIKSRAYTISNFNLLSSNVNLTVGLVEEKLKDKIYYGYCSSYLCQAKPGLTVRGMIENKHYSFLKIVKKPVILVSVGTGISLIRSILEERSYYKTEKGPCYVYYGCRKRDEDLIYEEELNEYCKSKVISKLHLALSRETSKKIYVQDILLDDSSELWSLIKKDCVIIVCGSINMGNCVSDSFVKIIEKEGKMNSAESLKYLEDLKHSNRFITELY